MNTDWMLDKALHKFAFGNAQIKGVYYDEENRRHLNTIRTAYAELSNDLANKGRKEEARKVLNLADKMMDPANFDYGMTSRGNMHNRNSLWFLESCYLAGDSALAQKVSASVKKDLQQQLRYYNSLSGTMADNLADERRFADNYLQALQQMQAMYNPASTLKGLTPADNSKK